LNVLDCGCGPGFTTFELANYLGKASRVVGIDLAEKYLRTLESRVAAEATRGSKSRIAKIETKNGTLDAFDLGETRFDAAYARWIFIFLKDPEAAIRNIARHLKPGALFMFQEYVDYRTMALHPSPPVFRKMVEAIIDSWAAHGGDANVAGRLPRLLERNGFEILGLKPQTRVGRPHQKIWKWPESFYKIYLPIHVRDGFLTELEAGECLRAWTEASRMENAFYVGPMVLDIIARKI
jgi:SAM-dependent methyltransferase